MKNFLRTTQQPQLNEQSNNQKNKVTGTVKKVAKRSYNKYKHVCLICAKDKDLKNKTIAILSRGGNLIIERHIKRNHPKLDVDEVKARVVALDHASVPKDIRKLASTNTENKAVDVVERSDQTTTHGIEKVNEIESAPLSQGKNFTTF